MPERGALKALSTFASPPLSGRQKKFAFPAKGSNRHRFWCSSGSVAQTDLFHYTHQSTPCQGSSPCGLYLGAPCLASESGGSIRRPLGIIRERARSRARAPKGSSGTSAAAAAAGGWLGCCLVVFRTCACDQALPGPPGRRRPGPLVSPRGGTGDSPAGWRGGARDGLPLRGRVCDKSRLCVVPSIARGERLYFPPGRNTGRKSPPASLPPCRLQRSAAAPFWGGRGRWFESSHSDQQKGSPFGDCFFVGHALDSCMPLAYRV